MDQVRRFLTGLKEVLSCAEGGGVEQQQKLSKLQILETGLAVLLQVTAEWTGKTQPLEVCRESGTGVGCSDAKRGIVHTRR